MKSQHHVENIKLVVLNAENLFLLFDKEPFSRPLTEGQLNMPESEWQKFSTSIYENKPLQKTKMLADSIKDMNPDIVALSEVGGVESLKNFNELFLDGKYSPVLVEGNSDRNIDVGFLVRKGLAYYYDLVSNKNRPINFLYPHEKQSQASGHPTGPLAKGLTSHKFSRDCVELWLFQKDRHKPFMIILLTHLKSPLDKDGVDPMGVERRTAELKTLVDIYNDLQSKYDIPIAVAGDFNGNASTQNTDAEFQDLYLKTPLKDALEIAQALPSDRATFYHVRNNGKSEGRQIDYCFLNPKLWNHVETAQTFVYRYKDAMGFKSVAPTTLDEKLRAPSDHYPLQVYLTKIPIF